MSKKIKDTIIIGFALFAMFFGAGNLLLPPYIGLQIGENIAVTILAFGLTGILLPFFGILAVVQSGNSIEDLGKRIHPFLAPILGSVIMLCIGPMIAIPRTGATTFEVGILPIFPNFNPIIASVLFFTTTWLLTISPSKVVDIIGSYLTPLLLVLLVLLVTVGIVFPLAPATDKGLAAAPSFSLGFTEGYQTLDVLASVIFAGIIIASANSKGYQSLKEKNSVVIKAGILSASFLFIIYGGLIYLGATTDIKDSSISRSSLLIHIAQSNLGVYGMYAIAVSIALACLTTAIALTSAVGIFFSRLTNNRLSYKFLVTICCIISGVLSISGVDKIIQFAYPPLVLVYPIVITLVLYLVIFGKSIKSRAPYIGALIGSGIVAVLTFFNQLNFFEESTLETLHKIPLFEMDLAWIIPSIIGFIIGLLISPKKPAAI